MTEAQLTAQLEHSCVPPVHDCGRLPDGRPFFTMNLIAGPTLGPLVEQLHEAFAGSFDERVRSEWSLRRLVEVFRLICEAAGDAHRRGVIHRDITPANILVGEFPEAFLIDWGLARRFEASASDDLTLEPTPGVATVRDRLSRPLTDSGSLLGTVAHMAPEAIDNGLAELSPASDVFSLGTILYEILAGRQAFSGESHLDVMLKVMDGPEVPASDLVRAPEGLGEICDRALAPRPERRFENASVLADRLADWL